MSSNIKSWKIILSLFFGFVSVFSYTGIASADADIIAWQNLYGSSSYAGISSGYVFPATNFYDVDRQGNFVVGSIAVMTSQNYFSPTLQQCLQIYINGVATSSASCVQVTRGTTPSIVNFPFANVMGIGTVTPKFGDTIALGMSSGAPATFTVWGFEYSPSQFIPYGILYGVGTASPVFYPDAINPMGIKANCGITDISGCITNAFSWAFVVPQSSIDRFTNINLASTSPFGYVYEMQSLWTTASATTSAQAVVAVDVAPWLGGITGSSSIDFTIISAAEIENVLGSTIWDFLQLLLAVVMWWGFMWYIWDKATHFI